MATKGESKKVTMLRFGVAQIPMRVGLDEYDGAFVPGWDEEYQIDDALLEDLAVNVEDDQPAYLVGPTGCGKSAGVLALASLCNQPARRMNLNGDVRSASFVGEKILTVDPKTGQSITEWRDGLLPDAMRRGHWVILDEFDACPPEIAMVVQVVLEGGHTLVLADNHGEVVRPHVNFRIFATGNTIGRGDLTGLYTGTHTMNEATLDRFTVIPVNYLAEAAEKAVVVAKCGIDEAVAGLMVEVARAVRSGFDKAECTCTFSTRRLIAWGKLIRRYLGDARSKAAWKTAEIRGYRLACGSKLGPEDRLYVAGIVQRVMSIDVDK
jgi:cobaltochelatase CobS